MSDDLERPLTLRDLQTWSRLGGAVMPNEQPLPQMTTKIGPDEALKRFGGDDDAVKMIFPSRVIVNLQDRTQIDFPMGVHLVAASMVDHPYLRQCGVKRCDAPGPNPLIVSLYRRLTQIGVGQRSSNCAVCGLQAGWPEGQTTSRVRHNRDCELAALYEIEGGQIEWR